MQSLLKRLRWQSPRSKSIKACPRCGSVNVRFSSRLDTWLTPRRYVCGDCGYVGPVILEIEETEEKKEAQKD